MDGTFVNYKMTDCLTKTSTIVKQETLFDISSVFTLEKAYYYGDGGAFVNIGIRYGKNRNQSVSIDFLHPHKHLYLDHSGPGIPITKEELALANKIRRRFNVK